MFWFFFALFIADATRFNSGVANLHIQPIQSLDAPELALYCTLRRVEEHERAGVLVATNAKVVKRLLASRYTVVSALLTPAWLEKLEPLLRARPEAEICVYVGEQKLLETITGYQLHQGALAVAMGAQAAGAAGVAAGRRRAGPPLLRLLYADARRVDVAVSGQR